MQLLLAIFVWFGFPLHCDLHFNFLKFSWMLENNLRMSFFSPRPSHVQLQILKRNYNHIYLNANAAFPVIWAPIKQVSWLWGKQYLHSSKNSSMSDLQSPKNDWWAQYTDFQHLKRPLKCSFQIKFSRIYFQKTWM